MPVLLTLLWPLERLNTGLLAVGRVIAVLALAIMVCLILGQIFWRYVLNDAPNWTEEAARFGMLWLVGLMAPLAYRQGGFVAIDIVERALPRIVAALLSLVLLGISLWVLLIAWDKGLNNHVDSLSGRGCSSSLRWPFGIEIGKCKAKFANQYQYAALWVGINLLILVNVELILRQVITVLGGGDRLKSLHHDAMAGAD
ncbi:TRAP transporter small permease subunit [Mameliella sp. CS4]|uniref:TRAP transporter small permease n=1 Tax=Mameliella sp. CS4 TaxID=2862329 RepID=UPI001C5DE0C3|nr:TRAP transporter small permease subunit [Mameliella sp. CS4]MBW4983178.1 TRAP transporter small permease subunit [Mameliella sp. CS4]